MSAANQRIADRVALAQAELSSVEIAAALALASALAFALLFLQDPLVHDSVHTVRHGAGITCH